MASPSHPGRDPDPFGALDADLSCRVSEPPGSYDHFLTHRRSRRLPGHDYASPGWYFIAAHTKDRARLFGEIRRGIMGLNVSGCVAHHCWRAIPEHLDGVHADAFIVMPDHVHGLIRLLPSADSKRARSLADVVSSLKSAVSRRARKTEPAFAWQPRYHERVVRDAAALHRSRD